MVLRINTNPILYLTKLLNHKQKLKARVAYKTRIQAQIEIELQLSIPLQGQRTRVVVH